MADDREALVSENQPLDSDKLWLVNENIRLRHANRVWKAIGIASLILLFAILVPLTIMSYEAFQYYQVLSEAQKNTVELMERRLQEEAKAKADGK
jgi:hypothetical protein